MIINSYFANSGVPALGLSPHIDVWSVVTGVGTQVIFTDPMIEVGGGFYTYQFLTYDPTIDYVFRSDGGITLSAGDRYSVGATETATVETKSVIDIVNGVWDQTIDAPRPAGSFGEAISQIKADTTNVVITQTSINALVGTLLKYERNRTKIDPAAKTLTVYDDNGITPLRVFDLKDHLGNASVIEVAERMPQ
jgi:hypothetical protein